LEEGENWLICRYWQEEGVCQFSAGLDASLLVGERESVVSVVVAGGNVSVKYLSQYLVDCNKIWRVERKKEELQNECTFTGIEQEMSVW
jgi:hypothetical protein